MTLLDYTIIIEMTRLLTNNLFFFERKTKLSE